MELKSPFPEHLSYDPYAGNYPSKSIPIPFAEWTGTDWSSREMLFIINNNHFLMNGIYQARQGYGGGRDAR
jgi:hypothetical protein